MQSYRSFLSQIYYCNDGMLELHFGLKSVAKPKQPITLNARIVVCHVCQFDSFLERSCYIAAK